MRPTFYLDHFYRCLDPEAFEAAKGLLRLFSSAKHTRKKTPEGFTWEGLYFYSRCGIYFEVILAESSPQYTWLPTMMGLASSHYGPDKASPFLESSYPRLEWSPFDMKREDGQSWFSGSITKVPPHYFLWNMDFAEDQLETRMNLGLETANNLVSLDSMECFVPRELFSALERALLCFSKRQGNGFQFSKKRGGTFHLIVNQVEADDSELLTSFHVMGRTQEGFPERSDFGPLRLETQGNHFSLKYKLP